MPVYAYGLLAFGWLVWFLPFPLTGWNRNTPAKSDPRARWGILIEVTAYALLWQGPFWTTSPTFAATTLSALFLAIAGLLSWTSTRALGRHLRFDAALSHDRQLVRSGPYRLLRHPIYTSMLCLLLGTGFLVATPIRLLAAVLLFVAGTEIRVRIEDGLLASRFGEQFHTYRRSVAAYVPYIR